MATRKISELNAITEAADDDVLVIVDISEETTNKITKSDFLIGTGHSIKVELNPNTYELSVILKNAAGTVLNTETVNLPSENALTNITYSNGNLTLIKQSGETSTVDISGLLGDLKEIIGVDTNTYNPQETYNIGDIVSKNEKIYKCKQNNVTGPFDISKWDEKSVVDIFNGKVDKVQGKGLSTEDYTTPEKNKLSGIETGAEVNIIEKVKVNNEELTPVNKEVNIEVPTKTSELENDSDFGTYSKPDGGIPESDLSNDVQESLEKADSALQEDDILGKEDSSNKTASLDESSTNTQYPGAKVVYDELKALKEENADLQEQVTDLQNNQLTGTVSGTEMDLSDSADSRVKSIELEGNSTQETVAGNQLLNLPDGTKTHNGIEGIITNNTELEYSGTATAAYANITNEQTCNLPIGTYTFSIDEATTKNERIVLYLIGESTQNVVIQGGNTSVTVTTSEVKISYKCGITNIVSGTTYSGKVKMMLNSGSTALPWEKYTGGIPSPNPEYEEPIYSAGDNVNELPNNQVTTNINGLDFIVNSDKSIIVRGTSTAQTDFYFVGNASQYEDLGLKEGVYNLNGCIGGSGTTYMLYLVRNRGGEISYFQNYDKNGTQISIEENDTFRIFIRVLSGKTVDTVFYPKLEKGSIATPYSPYGMGCVSEKIINKNIYDNIKYPLIANRAINTSTGAVYSSSSGNYYATEVYIPFDYAGKTISKTNTLELVYYNSNKEYISALVSQNTGVVPANTKYVRFDIATANKDFAQIEISNTPTTYVAHQEQNFIIPTQQPIRKIGNVRDLFFKNTVDSEYYDSTLTENAWYERHNIVHIVMNGTETITIFNSSSTRTVFQVATNFTFYVIKQNEESGRCTHFIPIWQGATWKYGDISTRSLPDGTATSLYPTMQSGMTIEQFKTWLSINNVETDMILKTPTNLLCTEAQTEALEAYIKARTYKPVTHMYSEDVTPAYQEVVYYKDTVGFLNTLEARIEALETEV